MIQFLNLQRKTAQTINKEMSAVIARNVHDMKVLNNGTEMENRIVKRWICQMRSHESTGWPKRRLFSKILLSVFGQQRYPIDKDYLQKGLTITGTSYHRNFLQKLWDNIKEKKRCDLLSKDVLLLADNTSAETLFFCMNGYETLLHSLYSPDLALSDFLFSNMKKYL